MLRLIALVVEGEPLAPVAEQRLAAGNPGQQVVQALAQPGERPRRDRRPVVRRVQGQVAQRHHKFVAVAGGKHGRELGAAGEGLQIGVGCDDAIGVAVSQIAALG